MPMKSLLLLLLALPAVAQSVHPTLGKLVSHDPAFDKLIPPGGKIEVLATGFGWTEGPVWVKNGGYLLFSDIPNNTIHQWKDGQLSVFLKPSGFTGRGDYGNEPGSNGLLINRKGELVACEHGDRRISAMPFSGGGKVTLAAHWQGKRFNAPNDICQHSSGAYYFTDPPYGLPKKENDPTREIREFGVYRIGTDGVVTQVISDLKRPNGVTLSPDEKTLYIAQSDDTDAFILAYPVLPDGSVGKGKLFYDASPLKKQGLQGAPDGIHTDSEGNVFSTGPGGVLVLNPQGKLLGRIETGELTANCAFGEDGYLYLTANHYLCRIKTTARGASAR